MNNPAPPRSSAPAIAASRKIERLFARFIGAGYLFYLLLVTPSVIATAHFTAGWWLIAAVVVTFVPGLALIPASYHREKTAANRVATITAAAFAVCVLTWPFAWTGETMSPSEGVWFFAFPGLASLAAALAWPAKAAFGYFVVVETACLLISHTAHASSHNSPLNADLAYGIGLGAVFVAAGVMARRTGRILDATRAETEHRAAAAAAAAARISERRRFDALTHDEVMSTLLAASRNPSSPTSPVAARSALTMLDTIALPDLGPKRWSSRETLDHLRGIVSDTHSRAEIAWRLEPEGSEYDGFPTDIVRSVGAALAEALRNVERHAGDQALSIVDITIAPSTLRVVVIDDGQGFDPDTVTPHRLGITESITARVEQHAGATATVQSRPGSGTRIDLQWLRPR